MIKVITILFLSLSFSLLANTNKISKNLKAEILKNNKLDKVSFVVFDLDNTLININVRYENIFNKYLKRNRSRVIKKYLKEKAFVNITLNDILIDIGNLKLNEVQKDKLSEYLKKEFYSDSSLKLDIANGNSVEFVTELHNAGAFIIYLTQRDIKYVTQTINILNELKLPIGVNKTTLIMNNDHILAKKTLSKWVNMGEIIAVFNKDLDILKSLKPYFKKNELFFISPKSIKDNKITTIKGF